jgi:hypothetical protein
MVKSFRTIGLLSAGGLFLLSAFAAPPSTGKRFGSREPSTCPSRKAPGRGAPSGAQAAQYFRCYFENGGSAETRYLASNVKVEVGRGRRFNPVSDSFSGIDTSQLVYDIRGSYDSYQCTFLGNVNGLLGKNCTHAPQPHAGGVCYKDTFGDWNCVFSDGSVGPSRWEYNVAPPTN